MGAVIFIDGREGTTGLRIFERLEGREGISILKLPEELRKSPEARKECLHSCDIAILCLPDAAAKESVSLLEGSHARVLDTSTAHRTLSDWAYGFPELSDARRRAIIDGNRVAVPGCHASGFISIAAPLIASGLLSANTPLSCHSLTGYSGGGRKMIAEYEAADRGPALKSPRPYGLTQQHKHLKEMTVIPGLTVSPIFAPIVADYYAGMAVTVPLFGSQIHADKPLQAVREALTAHYQGSPIVHVASEEECAALGGFVASNALAGKDGMTLYVFGNDERMQVVSLFDNLGKGSSGAALQCLNLMLGENETLGLNL